MHSTSCSFHVILFLVTSPQNTEQTSQKDQVTTRINVIIVINVINIQLLTIFTPPLHIQLLFTKPLARMSFEDLSGINWNQANHGRKLNKTRQWIMTQDQVPAY